MTSPALTRGFRKGLRTIAQVAAGGALTALVTAMAGGLDPSIQGLVMGAWVALVAFLQNWAESAGAIPTLLPSPGLVVGAAAGVAVGTVEAAADEAGEIVGDVVDIGGDVVGGVVGQLGGDHEAGRIAVVVAVVIAAIVLMFVACDAVFDDDDEADDLGQGVELVAGGNEDCGGEQSCRPGSDDCRDAHAQCSDDDFSPSFDKSPVEDSFNVQVCVTPGSCTDDGPDSP